MPAAVPPLRDRLLEATTVVVWGGGDAVATACGDLGARVERLGGAADEPALERAVAALPGPDVLVADVGGAFAAAAAADGAHGELSALRAGVDGAWAAVRAVANAHWVGDERPGGKLVLVAPRPGAGPHAEATRAAVENMARTLSIEWSRHGVRPTAIAPGDDADERTVATLVAFLASPAGDYYSGCRFDPGRAVA